MGDIKPLVDDVLPLAKGAQIAQMIKENQLITAVVLFILWQAGAVSQGVALVGC